ncbi:MAG: hypothetical protein F4138_07520 [Acidimicrobiia bacterium]|nr:hypothetical protein [Acidimicrobiia bacterium]
MAEAYLGGSPPQVLELTGSWGSAVDADTGSTYNSSQMWDMLPKVLHKLKTEEKWVYDPR